MSRQRKQVTLRWLQKHEACDLATEAFIEDWGKSGKPTVEQCVKVCWKRDHPDWASWLLIALLPIDLLDRWVTRDTTRRIDLAYAKKLMAL